MPMNTSHNINKLSALSTSESSGPSITPGSSGTTKNRDNLFAPKPTTPTTPTNPANPPKPTNPTNFPKKILGIRISALVEIVVFLTFLVFVNWVWGSGDRYLSIKPHPFWIVVLLAAVQYGTTEGLAATVLATLFLYVGNVPSQLVDETTFDYQLKLAMPPALWLIVSFVLGEIRLRLQHQIDKLTIERNDACQHAETITKNYELLKATKENLESRLAGQITTVARTYDTVRSLETLNPVQILMSVSIVVKSALQPTKFSVFASGPNGLEATTSQGWKETDSFLRRFPVHHPLYEEIVVKKRMISVVNQKDEETLSGQGIMAAPLVDRETGDVFGMLKIEEIEFFKLDIGNLETFKTLCDLIGSAYGNAQKYKKAVTNAIYFEGSGVFSYNLYVLQRQYLEGFCVKTSTPLSQITIKHKKEGKLSKEEKQSLFENLYAVLMTLIPEGTPVFHNKEGEMDFVLLLPSVKKNDVEQLSHRIFDGLMQKPELQSYQFHITTETIVESEVLIKSL